VIAVTISVCYIFVHENENKKYENYVHNDTDIRTIYIWQTE